MCKDNQTKEASGFSAATGSIPPLQIVKNPQGDYALNGWDDVNRWGCHNHPAWNYVTKHAEAQGWDELTKLKVLADTLMRHHVELQTAATEMLKRQPIPPIVLSSNGKINHE